MLSEKSQNEVVEFLSDAKAYRPIVQRYSDGDALYPADVQRINTHCAHIFLAGDDVIKVKRAVKYSYLDMSSLEKRRLLCQRELELNQPFLPSIYLDVVPIRRTEKGLLSFNGNGEVVEWAVHMKRFSEESVLDNMARKGELSVQLARQTGRSIADYHAELNSANVSDGHERLHEIVEELVIELSQLVQVIPREQLKQFERGVRQRLSASRERLNERALSGFVKRCHGDLHLRNIVVFKNRPVPFDALEFDERLATTDVLYDLAFLLMDLEHRELLVHANATFNQYLIHSDERNLQALELMTLFLSCRAAIRAMTTAQAVDADADLSCSLVQEARQYLSLAIEQLQRQCPMLVAIGGLSGSGKSTVAAMVAPYLHNPPGAVLLRSDAERKAALNVEEDCTLPDSHYTSDASHRNYELLARKAGAALEAGAAVVVDAVFLSEQQRRMIEREATIRNIPFIGLWLDVEVDILRHRVEGRHGDASDATVAVLERQLRQVTVPVDWKTINANNESEAVVDQISGVIKALRPGE